jgi:hypothetical protein
VSDAVRVGLNRFVLYAFIGKALEELIEPTDGKRNPAGTCVRRVRLDEQRGVFVDVPKDLVPDAEVRGRPKTRVYQSMLVARSATGTPATRLVIALCIGPLPQDPRARS